MSSLALHARAPRAIPKLRVLEPEHAVWSRAAATLIERTFELEVLGGAVAGLAGSHGAVVVLDGPAGLGKTVLLDHATALAADAGCLVRRAAPGPLERHFPFGVVRALLEAPVRGASAARRGSCSKAPRRAPARCCWKARCPAATPP